MKFTLIGIMLTGMLLMACATSQFGWAPDPSAEGNSQAAMKEDFDFVELEKADADLADDDLETSSGYSAAKVKPVSPTAIKETTSMDAGAMVLGFRVQLMTAKDELNAREAKKDALFKFQQPIYLEFDSSLWKLRVGDCETRAEAEALKEVAIRKGYRDAFIVNSKVLQGNN